MTRPFGAHPPIFQRVLDQHANPEILGATYDPDALLALRGLAAFLSFAEAVDGRPIDGARYRDIQRRAREVEQWQTKERLHRWMPRADTEGVVEAFATRTISSNSENKETS